MSGDEKPGRKLRGLWGILVSLVTIAILTYIAVILISGRDSFLRRIFGSSSSREPVKIVDEYSFEAGRSKVFASLDGAVAAVGTLGVQVLDRSGAELLRDPCRMLTPAVNVSTGKAVAFDIGGNAVRVLSSDEMTASFETESPIISASVNDNGWFCVCVRDDGGYRSIATVYNNLGKDVYRVSLGSGYILSAILSNDNRNLAVLSLTDRGSKIEFYELSSENVVMTFDLPDRLIIDQRYLSGGDLLVVTMDSMIAVDKNGKGRELHWFAGKRLGAYTVSGGLIAMHLLDYGVGYSGRLVTLDGDGAFMGTIVTSYEIISMSAGEDYLAVLRSDGVALFDRELAEILFAPSSATSAGADSILALGDGAALVSSDHSAVIVRIGSSEPESDPENAPEDEQESSPESAPES